jgi:predicted acetyltransferase
VTVTIRTISEDEFPAYVRANVAAFGDVAKEEDIERERRLSRMDRCLAAFDGTEIVGTAAAFEMPMTIPGGDLAVGFVTMVGVKPTHRRRGINTQLMRAQLDDCHEREEAVAILYASEGGIYGRYGYGLATFGLDLRADSGSADFVRGYRPSGGVRLVERDEAIKDVLSVLEAIRAQRPGMVGLNEDRFEYAMHEHGEDAKLPRLFALHEGDGGVDGYAMYRVKHDWPGEIPSSTVEVLDLQAADPGACADLWRYVLDLDLIEHVRAWNRPVDEPLLHLVAEPRRLRATVRDNLWLRPVDVEAALASRRYAAEGRVVLEVGDAFCPWNDGRYAVEADADGHAAVERSTGDADFACTVNEVGAVYLGGASFRQLRRAGRVEEWTAGALARADAMFAWDPAPWCPYVF